MVWIIFIIPKNPTAMVKGGRVTNAQVYSFFVFLSFILHSISECGKALPFFVKQWLQTCL